MPNFHLRKPGAFHRARFMAKAIYFMKIAILLYHPAVQEMYTQREVREITTAVCQSFQTYLKILKTYQIPTSFDENTYQKPTSQ